MSWDIFVMDLPPGITSIAEIPKDFVGSPLGQRSEIIAKISALYPASNFADRSWGTLQLPECWIEFGLGSEEEVQSFAMHVRGGEPAPDIVAHILAELGMRALDPSSASGLFEQDPVLRSESFARWQSFRSHVAAVINDQG
jgi:hypothetical protein